MKHIVQSNKSVDQAVADLEAAVKRHSFGVLHSYDLKQTLLNKGIELVNECRMRFKFFHMKKISSFLRS